MSYFKLIKSRTYFPLFIISLILFLISGVLYLVSHSIVSSIDYQNLSALFLHSLKSELFKSLALLAFLFAIIVAVISLVYKKRKIDLVLITEIVIPLIAICFVIKAFVPVLQETIKNNPTYIDGLLVAKETNKGIRGGVSYTVTINSGANEYEVKGNLVASGFESVNKGDKVRALISESTKKVFFIEKRVPK